MTIDASKLASLTIDDQTSPHTASGSRKWAWLALSSVLVIGAGVVFLSVDARDSEPQANTVASTLDTSEVQPSVARQTMPKRAEKPLQTNSENSITASGYVVARKTTTVSASVAGVVKHVYVEEGQKVQAGDLLAELESDAARVQVQAAESELITAKLALEEARLQLDKLELDLSRSELLAKKQMISDAELKQTVLNVDLQRNLIDSAVQRQTLAEKRVELARIDLSYKQIRAPFSGIVTEISAQPGEIVSPISGGGGFIRTGICTIVDLSSLVVEVDINEKHLDFIEQRHAARIRLDAFSQSNFTGTVDYIVPVIDKLKGAVKVRIANTNFDHRALPGMGVQVWIDKHSDTSLVTNHKESTL